MAGCGDQVRGIANDNRLSIVGHLGAGNLSEFCSDVLIINDLNKLRFWVLLIFLCQDYQSSLIPKKVRTY